MSNRRALGVALFAAAGAMVLLARGALANASPDPSGGLWPETPQSGDGWGFLPGFDFTPDGVGEPYSVPGNSSTPEPYPAPSGASVRALLELIGKFESNGDYSALYGGRHFNDFSTHPNVRVPFYNPKKPGPAGTPNDVSTAAGKYQINFPTWRDFAPRVGRTDFTPEAQDAYALAILEDTGAYNALMNGDTEGAIRLASRRWASLPGSTAGQNPRTMTSALATYNSYLAVA